MQTIIYIFPELFLSFSIMLILMVGVFVKKSFKLVNLLTVSSLIFTIALVLNQQNETIKIFKDSYIIDNFSILIKTITLLFCILILISSKDESIKFRASGSVIKFDGFLKLYEDVDSKEEKDKIQECRSQRRRINVSVHI